MIIGLVLASAPGYSETFFYSKIKGLQASGYQVILFCSKNSQNFKQCPVILLPKQYVNLFKQISLVIWLYLTLIPHFKVILRFVKLERNNKVSWLRILKCIYSYAPIFKMDLDWLHFGFGTLAIGAENLAGAKQAKMAVSFRGFDIGVYPIKYPNCYKRLWDKVFKIHVISDDIASLVFKHGFQGQAPMIKITPAINTSHFNPPKKFNFRFPIKLISVARLHWKKGLDYTLEALALLKQEGVKFEYRIIGEGPEEEALKFATYQFGLQDEVIFMGKLEPENVKQELAKSQIYIQYSVQEGFCNAALEAQAMGLLSIVSNAEGLSENVLDEQTGWVIDKRKPDLLALKIKEVLELSEAQKNKIRNSAILRIQQEFNSENQQRAFNEFYKNN